jgi:hypothetical protein
VQSFRADEGPLNLVDGSETPSVELAAQAPGDLPAAEPVPAPDIQAPELAPPTEQAATEAPTPAPAKPQIVPAQASQALFANQNRLSDHKL